MFRYECDLYAPTDSETAEELVPQTFALSNSRETAVLNLLSVELEGVVGELETLLDERGELADAATLLTQNLLGVGGADDDLGRAGSLKSFDDTHREMLTSVRA